MQLFEHERSAYEFDIFVPLQYIVIGVSAGRVEVIGSRDEFTLCSVALWQVNRVVRIR